MSGVSETGEGESLFFPLGVYDYFKVTMAMNNELTNDEVTKYFFFGNSPIRFSGRSPPRRCPVNGGSTPTQLTPKFLSKKYHPGCIMKYVLQYVYET